MKLKAELSVAEQLMFTKLGYAHFLEMDFAVVPFYRMIVEECFCKNIQGPAVEALRVAYGRISGYGVSGPQFRGCITHDKVIEEKLNFLGSSEKYQPLVSSIMEGLGLPKHGL